MDFKQVNFYNIIILIFVIVGIYFFYDKYIDYFENDKVNEKITKNKECSNASINKGFRDYIFEIPKKFVRWQ